MHDRNSVALPVIDHMCRMLMQRLLAVITEHGSGIRPVFIRRFGHLLAAFSWVIVQTQSAEALR